MFSHLMGWTLVWDGGGGNLVLVPRRQVLRSFVAHQINLKTKITHCRARWCAEHNKGTGRIAADSTREYFLHTCRWRSAWNRSAWLLAWFTWYVQCTAMENKPLSNSRVKSQRIQHSEVHKRHIANLNLWKWTCCEDKFRTAKMFVAIIKHQVQLYCGWVFSFLFPSRLPRSGWRLVVHSRPGTWYCALAACRFTGCCSGGEHQDTVNAENKLVRQRLAFTGPLLCSLPDVLCVEINTGKMGDVHCVAQEFSFWEWQDTVWSASPM